MKQKPNYYQLLHVQPDAPREIIRSSYRTMMQRMRMHPDLGGDGESAAALNEAYSVLMEPSNRAAYDRLRQEQERALENAEAANDASGVNGPDDSPLMETAQTATCFFCNAPCDISVENAAGYFCGRCYSPLSKPELVQGDEDDRRSILRVPNDQVLEFRTHWPQRDPYLARSGDISLDGMRFLCTPGLQDGQIIKIDAMALRAVARVTRAVRLGESWEVGVKFLTVHFQQVRGSFIRDRV